ncbi:MAG: hypothetical protein LBH43_12430 [Treponema sp.]|jgi:hypothetical protein|nr:hypothetical protein [Treponema sp.]
MLAKQGVLYTERIEKKLFLSDNIHSKMSEINEYMQVLSEALKKRGDWLDKNELPKLKEGLRLYHTGFASLYNLYLKKGLIHEDPYKQEAKIGELEVPDTKAFAEGKRFEELTTRLAAFDNQLDFLVNFYQFSADFLTLERIKRIVGLVKYIEWVNLTPDSQSAVTRAVAEMTSQIKTAAGTDKLTMSVITESLAYLNKCFTPIMGYLKVLSDYQRELYKLELRETVTINMSQNDAGQLPVIRKKFAQANPGKPFYPDLADEVIKEDTTKEGQAIKEKILKSLQIAEAKPKVVKPQVSFKTILLEGIMVTGSTATSFQDIVQKMDENVIILENQNHNFLHTLKKLLNQVFSREPDPVIYDLEYIDPIKGVPVREKININVFRNDVERRTKTLQAVNAKGPGLSKLEAMQDEQLITFLERNIRDIQSFHKTLTALDEFFKAEVERSSRDKVKGIKPELGTIKNAAIRANAKRHEYSAQKEEEEQLKRLGVGSAQPEE